MKIIKSIAAFRKWKKNIPGGFVLVPTMGALHKGHIALMLRARKHAGKDGLVGVSIFVNPTQFGPREDYKSYPRTPTQDLAICRKSGVDVVFLPSVEEMYAADRSISVEETSLSHTLCGKARPGHFRGVCTIVAKLFLIMQPTAAIFGEKDWQQLAIIRRMVRDLNFPVRILAHPTVREVDGLAMSSRNTYLTPKERSVAPQIHATLQDAAERDSPAEIVTAARKKIARIPGVRVDYVEAVDAETLTPLLNRKRDGRLAVAVYLGRTRLIDNISIPQKHERV